MDKYEDIQVLLLGEMGTGKTSIINRLVKHTFESEVLPTLVIETRHYKLNKSRFIISDYSGRRQYNNPMYKKHFKSARVFILVYSIIDRNSFQELEKYWYEEVLEFAEFPCKINF